MIFNITPYKFKSPGPTFSKSDGEKVNYDKIFLKDGDTISLDEYPLKHEVVGLKVESKNYNKVLQLEFEHWNHNENKQLEFQSNTPKAIIANPSVRDNKELIFYFWTGHNNTNEINKAMKLRLILKVKDGNNIIETHSVILNITYKGEEPEEKEEEKEPVKLGDEPVKLGDDFYSIKSQIERAKDLPGLLGVLASPNTTIALGSALALGGLAGAFGFTVAGAEAIIGSAGISTALKVGTGVAGVDTMMVWLAEDNIITGCNFTVKKLKEAVNQGIISKSEALRQIDEVIKWVDVAESLVETSIKLNPLIAPFHTVLRTNIIKGRFDINLERKFIERIDIAKDNEIDELRGSIRGMEKELDDLKSEKSEALKEYKINKLQMELKKANG